MKKIYYIIITLVILVLVFLLMLFNKKKKTIDFYIDKNFEYREVSKIKDYVPYYNLDDYVDTYELGSKHFSFETKDCIYNVYYSVIDSTDPIMMGVSNITIKKGDNVSFDNRILCGDNYDRDIKCNVVGTYDINKVGTYNLKYVAIDSSNNKTEKSFKLIVKDSITKSSSKEKPKFIFSDLIKNYKNENTLVGIDVSSWQDNIDYKKVKDAGCDFVIIRIGYGHSDDKLVLDKWFYNNIKGAKENDLLVGIYFYSYAKTTNESIAQANWIIDKLNNEKIDLPVAFDFENWSKFNTYGINFNDLNDIADSFINTLNKHGYDGMLYGSASYLNNIWNTNNKKVWLAHYASKTDYSKNYIIWQLSNRGKIDGINSDVDLDILYK